MGPLLTYNMRKQAERFGPGFPTGWVNEPNLLQRPLKLKAEGVGELMGEAMIISTGASARLLGIQSEKASIGRGVSTCATCDVFFYCGKKMIVVGGDSALENFLTRFAEKIRIAHRRSELRASKMM